MDEGRFASNMNRAITIVDDYLIYIIKRSRERERERIIKFEWIVFHVDEETWWCVV